MTDRDDSGITLIEVVVYVIIAGLFLGLLAALFANGIRAQAQATDRDLATGRAAVLTDSIQTSIRNSSGFVIVSQNRALIARTTAADGSSVCRAWLVVRQGDLEFRRTPSSPPFQPGDLIYKQTTSVISFADTAGWTALIERGAGATDGVRGALSRRDGTNADGSPRLVPVDADADGITDVFGRDGSTLSVGVEVRLGEATIPVTSGVTMQTAGGPGGITCW
jgi:type II secretory pathway pseudopilin PulG